MSAASHPWGQQKHELVFAQICFPACREEDICLSLALFLYHDAFGAESLALCQIRITQGGTQPEDWDPQLGGQPPCNLWLLTPGWLAAQLGQLGSWPQPVGRTMHWSIAVGRYTLLRVSSRSRGPASQSRLNTVQPVQGTVPAHGRAPRLARPVCAAMTAEHLQWEAQQRLAGFTVSFTILLVCRIANRLARGGYAVLTLGVSRLIVTSASLASGLVAQFARRGTRPGTNCGNQPVVSAQE